MSGDLSKFEVESTKTPIWLPVAGVVLFFVVAVLAVMCPGEPLALGDGGTRTEQSE